MGTESQTLRAEQAENGLAHDGFAFQLNRLVLGRRQYAR